MPEEEITQSEDDILDGRLTILEPEPIEEYALVGSAAPEDATTKLGMIEDLIESGELMTPAVKPNDTVWFVYRDTVVLEGKLANVFSEYNIADDKYYYYVTLINEFYRLSVTCPASEYGQTWFKTQAEADAALLAIQEEEENEP